VDQIEAYILLGNKRKKTVLESSHPNPKQPSVSAYFKSPDSNSLQKKVDGLLFNFIVNGLHALSIVEEHGFKELISGKSYFDFTRVSKYTFGLLPGLFLIVVLWWWWLPVANRVGPLVSRVRILVRHAREEIRCQDNLTWRRSEKKFDTGRKVNKFYSWACHDNQSRSVRADQNFPITFC
jgi:hypothetical protein